MTDFENLEQNNAESTDESDDIKISDLPPETRSHYLLLRLTHTRERLRPITRAFSLNTERASQQEAHPDRAVQNIEHQAQSEDKLEISDLPPTTRNHYLLLVLQMLRKRLRAAFSVHGQGSDAPARPVLTRAQRHAKIGRTLTALGLCATLLLLLIGNVPTLRTQLIGIFEPATPTPTVVAYDVSSLSQGNVPIVIEKPNDPYVTPTPTNGLGRLPATCPRATTLQYFLTTLDPPGLGSGPLWLSDFDGPTAALVHLQPTSQLPGTVPGWYQPLTVFIQRGFTGTLVLHGVSQNGTDEIEFSYANSSYIDSNNGDTMNFAPSLILSLDNPPSGVHFSADGDWEITTIDILVPKAGCYTLQTSWSNSVWTEYFAAGG